MGTYREYIEKLKNEYKVFKSSYEKLIKQKDKFNSLIESDKKFIEEFYIKRNKNYLKMDCYRKENGEYYWE